MEPGRRRVLPASRAKAMGRVLVKKGIVWAGRVFPPRAFLTCDWHGPRVWTGKHRKEMSTWQYVSVIKWFKM